MTLNAYLSIVALNVNELNDPIKGAVSDGIKRQDPLFVVYKGLIVDLRTPKA